MNKKAKFYGLVRRVFFNILGNSRSKAFLSYFYGRKFRKRTFSFPIDNASIKQVLIILPDQKIEILYQLQNLLSLISLFKNAAITLFCEKDVSSFVKMVLNEEIIEFDKSTFSGFGPELKTYTDKFKDTFDICILLDRTPDISILYLLGATNAPIRAGYEDAVEYPFLNLKTRSSRHNRYIPDRNCIMTDLFGGNSQPLQISISKKTLEEIDYLLKGAHIDSDQGLVGIDALFFLKRFGDNWFNTFLSRLFQIYKGKSYFYVSDLPSSIESAWLGSQEIPILIELTPSKVAALIQRTDLVISGNTEFYGIAALLNIPAIGFFQEDEIHDYCPNTNKLKGFIYNQLPDEKSIDILLESIAKISAKKIKYTRNRIE